MNKAQSQESPDHASNEDIYNLFASRNGLHKEDFYLTYNGRLFHTSDYTSDYFEQPASIQLHLRVLGGKGGFGSMLRAIGARIEKTTNHEACRDLSGRRMRDVNNEKKIADWLKAKEEKEEERSKKRQEKLEKILNPKFTYEDNGYTLNLHKNADNVDEALKQALKNRKVGDKRKVDGDNKKDASVKKKSKMTWMGLDEDVSDEDEKEDEDFSPDDSSDNKSFNNDEKSISRKVHTKSLSNNDQSTVEQADTVTGELPHIKEMKSEDDPAAVATGDRHPPAAIQAEALDLTEYSSAEQLEAVGLDRLKSALLYLGLKCGGTLQERAQRLYMTKHTPIDQLDASLFSKTKKKKK